MRKQRSSDEAALRSAAERGDLQATFALVELLDGRGQYAESAGLLGAAARRGALAAIAELGARTALGAGVPADVPAAGALLGFAAERGEGNAGRWLLRLAIAGALPDGTATQAIGHLARDARRGDHGSLDDLSQLAGEPGAPDPAAIAAYSESAAASAWAAPLPVQWCSDDPQIGRCDGLLPARACDSLVADARPALARAGVTDRATGTFALDAARTNASAQVAFFTQPIALVIAKRRLATLAGEHGLNLERTNILHYRPGEAFAAHWDYLDPAAPGFAGELAAQGQRIATCLIGLTEDYEGGETDFPERGIRERIPRGGALFFRNVDRTGAPDPRTLHAGLPVTRGEKWVVSQWVRTRAHPL